MHQLIVGGWEHNSFQQNSPSTQVLMGNQELPSEGISIGEKSNVIKSAETQEEWPHCGSVWPALQAWRTCREGGWQDWWRVFVFDSVGTGGLFKAYKHTTWS